MAKKSIYSVILVIITLILCSGLCNAEGPIPGYVIEEKAIVLTAEISDGDNDICPQVQPLLNEARDSATAEKPYVIVIPKGKYSVANSLLIYSNTTIYMADVELSINASEGAAIRGGYPSENEVGGYDDYENISVIGGKITSSNDSSLIRFAHGKNIRIQGITFNGGNTSPECPYRHLVEVAAIDGFNVSDCTFENCLRPDGQIGIVAGNGWEALQMDNPCTGVNFKGYISDGTPMKNVTIENNTFSSVVRGVGTHTSLLGVYAENIKIINNTFNDIADEAIVAFNYYNCEISGNSIDSGRGIRIVSINPSLLGCYMTSEVKPYRDDIYSTTMRYDLKIAIKDNSITAECPYKDLTSAAITVYGAVIDSDTTVSVAGQADRIIPAGDYGISGISIENNTLISNSTGIELFTVKECNISNNKISAKNNLESNKNFYGIYVGGSETNDNESVTIDNNEISGFKDYLICVNGISARNITNNSLSDSIGNGISLIGAKNMLGDISQNKILNIKKNGIYIGKSSGVSGDISSNEINNCGEYGIAVSDNSTVSGAINSNKIDSATKGAILVNNSSAVLSGIKNDIISSCGGSANIYVGNSSTIKKGIAGNSITNSDSYGMYVSSSTVSSIQKNNISTSSSGILAFSSAVSLISSNSITSIGTPSGTIRGIYIYGASPNSKIQAIIQDNIISKIKDYLIAVNSATIKNISNNTLSDTTGSGIFLGGNSVITEEIEYNNISNASKTGIYINSSAVKGNINSNSVSSCGNYGILLSEKSTIDGEINSNTISDVKSNAIAIIGYSAVAKGIKKNIISKSTKDAININSSTINGGIENNTVATVKSGNGIMIYQSKVYSGINSNSIKSVYINGINISKNSKISKVNSNYINSCQTGNGIMLNDHSAISSSISSNTIKNIKGTSKCGIFIYNNSSAKAVSSNNISAVPANGISIYSISYDMTVTENSLSKCEKNSIYINPSIAKFTVTISKNKIEASQTGTGIQTATGKVSIYSNTIKNACRPIILAKGVVATIYKNTLSGNKYNSYYVAGKYYNIPNTPSLTLQALSKSFKATTKGSGSYSGYKLQYSKSSSFSSAVNINIKGTGAKSKTINELIKGKKYYVRSRSYYTPLTGVTFYGNYCSTKSVTCK